MTKAGPATEITALSVISGRILVHPIRTARAVAAVLPVVTALLSPASARGCTRIWAEDPGTGERRDLTLEEHHGLWTWATVEVLRHTGIRVEELTDGFIGDGRDQAHIP